MQLQLIVTIDFDEDQIDEASVSEIFDSAAEGVYIDGIESVTVREA
jgi:hypothetical protein